MVKNMRTRKKYDDEFKKNAVNMLLTSGMTAKDLANDLDVSQDLLSRWKRQFIANSSGKIEKKLDPKDIEIKELKKKLLNVTMERDILKKSIAIFSKI